MQYIDMTIELPWIHILRTHNRCEVFPEVLAEHVNSVGPQSEKSSCIFRASPAQAPRKQKDASRWKWGTGPHMFHRVIIPTKILPKEGLQNIAREICPHNGGEKGDNALQWRKGKGKQGAMSCPVAVVQLRLRIRLTEKRSAQVHWCREIEAWVFLLAGLMIVRQGMFFPKAAAKGSFEKSVAIKDCHQSSAEVMAVFKDCNQTLPKVLLEWWLSLKIVIKHCPKFCWSDGCL